MKNRALIPTIYLAMTLLISCEESAPESTQASPEIKHLNDSVAHVRQELDNLAKLDDNDRLQLKLDEVNQSGYSNFIFNTAQLKTYEEYHGQTVLTEEAKVYRSTKGDTVARGVDLIETLPAYTPILVKEKKNGMYLIEYGNALNGYVADNVICEFNFVEHELAIQFFVWTSKRRPFGDREVSLMARDLETGQLMDKITVPFRVHSYRAERRTTALKHAEYVIALNFYRESCPGHEEDCLYAFHEGKFQEIICSFSMGEYGWYSFNTPMIPVRFENDHILHIAQADLKNPVDWQTGKPGHYTVPDSIDIPLDELVVVHSKAAESKMDANYQEIPDENGEPIMEVEGEAFHFYHWDGTKLTLVQSTNPDYFAK